MINPVDKVFDELYVGFKELIKQNIEFQGKLEGIEAKLEDLKPVIQEMVQSNEVLDRSRKELKGLTVVMESGIKLIAKCSKCRVWRVYHRYKYANKLTEWETSLQSQLVILNVYTARDGKDTLKDVKEIARVVNETKALVENIEEKVNRIVIQNQPGEPTAWVSTEVPELPRFTVGLDTHLKKLKMKLLKGGVSMLVLTGHGGSGKTTLAKTFYHDHEVKGIL